MACMWQTLFCKNFIARPPSSSAAGSAWPQLAARFFLAPPLSTARQPGLSPAMTANAGLVHSTPTLGSSAPQSTPLSCDSDRAHHNSDVDETEVRLMTANTHFSTGYAVTAVQAARPGRPAHHGLHVADAFLQEFYRTTAVVGGGRQRMASIGGALLLGAAAEHGAAAGAKPGDDRLMRAWCTRPQFWV